MDDANDVLDPAVEPEEPRPAPAEGAPIESRFLFVDVAAMRAKQLRRGALPRLDDDDAMAGDPSAVSAQGRACRDGGGAPRPRALRRAAVLKPGETRETT